MTAVLKMWSNHILLVIMWLIRRSMSQESKESTIFKNSGIYSWSKNNHQNSRCITVSTLILNSKSMPIREISLIFSTFRIKTSLLLLQMTSQSTFGMLLVIHSNKLFQSHKYSWESNMPTGNKAISSFYILEALMQSFTFMMHQLSNKKELFLVGTHSIKAINNNKATVVW